MSTRTSVSRQSNVSQSTDSVQEDSCATLARDDVFHLLQNQRRRLVLRYLTEHDSGTSIEMREVAEQVAAWENDTTVALLTSDARQRVYIALYQSHLPKFDESGVIEYNQDRGMIEPQASLSQLEPYIQFDTNEEVKTDNESDTEADTGSETEWTWQWNDYYLGLTVLSMLSVVGVAFYPSSSAGLWLSAIITGVFGVSALIQRF
jgi:hypothetical protein